MKNIKLLLLALFALTGGFLAGCDDDDDDNNNNNASVEIVDTTINGQAYKKVRDLGNGTGNITMAPVMDGDSVQWLLEGFVFVNSGQTLNVEPGTVIKGMPGTGENASALIIARGGSCDCQGTATDPIIMTALNDNLDGNLPVTTRGEWGGMIILGNANTNRTAGENAIEGIPTEETRGVYGGSNDADNSGTYRYISIRHGGTDIGDGNEINGLSMGGVGSGTTIEYIEVFANQDDGFEWFGGSVNTKYLVSSYCGDDYFDVDEGWNGNNQYWLAVQDPNTGNRLMETDGASSDNFDVPDFSRPVIYNATLIGNNGGSENQFHKVRQNYGGQLWNSIIMFKSTGVDFDLSDAPQQQLERFTDGPLAYANNFWYGISTLVESDSAALDSAFTDSLLAWGNVAQGPSTASPLQNAVVDPSNPALDVRPTSVIDTVTTAAPGDAFFDNTSYVGAFDPNATPWIMGWTKTAEVLMN